MSDTETQLDKLRFKVDFLNDELVEMRAVLQWASDNVDVVYGPHFYNDWTLYRKDERRQEPVHAPTLYACLHSAWLNRQEQPVSLPHERIQSEKSDI